jgi:hypothetical protein
MIDSQEELFAEPKGSQLRWAIGAVAAVVISALLLLGYGYLRKRHAQDNAGLEARAVAPPVPKASPKALILVDDAMMQGSKSLVGGTVKNISDEKLGDVSVELELKRRNDGTTEKRLVPVEPGLLDPDQEGQYSLELKAQDYGSARLTGLRVGPSSAPLPYTTAQGKKRPLERLESKTIVTGDRRSSKRNEFLNSPDKPARVP